MQLKELTERRSSEQNRLLHARLGDVAAQVKWMCDGELVYLNKDEWRMIFAAALNRHQRVAKGIDGGWVMLGASTSRMSKVEMADLITLVESFGAERGVVWTDEQAP